jgi:hypothetical protein
MKTLTELPQLCLFLAALFTSTVGVTTVVLGPNWELAIYGATDQTQYMKYSETIETFYGVWGILLMKIIKP